MMKIARGLLGITVVASGVVLAACGNQEPGTPTTSETKRSGAGSAQPTGQPISPVNAPLDPSAWLSSPCQALSSDDLAEIGLATGQTAEGATSNAKQCKWKAPEVSGQMLFLSVMTENANGINDIHRIHADSELREEVEIGGYPALHANFTDNRPDGQCSLWIGVNDSEVLFLDAYLGDATGTENPCGYADRAGEAIVRNLSG